MKENNIEKDINKYLKAVKDYLFCDYKKRKEFVSEIETAIYDYAEKKGISDISEIYSHFGTPEEVAKTYISQTDPAKIKRAVNIRRIVIGGVIAVITIVVVFFAACFIDTYDATNGYFEEEVFIEEEFTIEDEEIITQ